MLALAAGFVSLGAHLHDDFSTTPFARDGPRWCERYHHGHYADGVVRFSPSTAAQSECDVGRERAEALSCAERGCGPCGCCGDSPCAKVGDRLRNAVIQTTSDSAGSRRRVRATFQIERQLPAEEAHLGIYAALHPHCHTTVQALLVHDGADRYHLNVAAFNQFIGGDPEAYRSCREAPLAEISPALASGIVLREGARYRWTLRAEVDAAGFATAFSSVRHEAGELLGAGEHSFRGAPVGGWFGVAGRAARFGFGAQLGVPPSPSRGDPSVLLLDFEGSASGPGGRAR